MEHYQNRCISVGEVTDIKVQSSLKEALLSKRADLTEELKELDAALARVQEEYSLQVEQLQAQKKPLEDALHHLEALLRFEGYCIENSHNARDSSSSPGFVARASITDAAFNLLAELHQPMHYRDIATKLQETNNYIPGKDPAATLLSRMSRDNRFKRIGKRGVYGLLTWRARAAKHKSINRRKTRKR